MMPEEKAWEDSFRSFLMSDKESEVFDDSPASHIIISQIFNQSPVGIVVVSPTEEVLLINRVAAQMFDYDREAMPDPKWQDMKTLKTLCSSDESPLGDNLDPIYMALRERRRTTSNVLFKTPGADYEEWATITAFPVFASDDRERVIASVASFIDITDFKGMQDILYYQATHDPLTGLSNKALLSASMGKAFARAKRGHSCGAVLFLDVDKFKRVNDSLGHAAGDSLLAKVADRICSEVRETDIVARVGGDEFAILLADIERGDDLKVAGEVAERICRSVSRPFVIWGQEVYVSISIGISVYPPHGLDEESLLAKADAAMYQVKENGRNGWRFWGDIYPGADKNKN